MDNAVSGQLQQLLSAVQYLPELIQDDTQAMVPYLVIGVACAIVISVIGISILRKGYKKHTGNYEKFPAVHLLFPVALGTIVFFIIYRTLSIESLHNMEATYIGLNVPLQDLLIHDLMNNHFPLYRICLWSGSHIHSGLVFYRSMSALFFCMSFIPFYNLTRKYFGITVGALATVLFGISPYAIYYAKVVEPYSLLLSTSVFFIWFFAIHIEHPKTTPWPLIITGILGCYLHTYYLFLVAAAICAIVLLTRIHSVKLESREVILGSLLAFAAPIIVFLIVQFPLKSANLSPQVILKMYFPFKMSPEVVNLRDFLLLFGISINMDSASAALVTGIIMACAMLAGFIIGFRRGKTRSLFLMGLLVMAICVCFGFYYHRIICRDTIGGWYPSWRHNMVLFPFIFLAAGSLITVAFKNKAGKAVAVVAIAVVLVFEVKSDMRILYGKNIPDSKAAWDYISPRLNDGDAILATPVPWFMEESFDYYAFPHDASIGGAPSWIKINEDKKVLVRFSDLYASYESMRDIQFVRRIWNVRYDYRHFGLFPEFNDYGQRLFDEKFSGWRIIEEKHVAFLDIRLLEAPPPLLIDMETIHIKAGVNDMKFIRDAKESVFRYMPERTITEETELLLPVAPARKPVLLTIRTPARSITRCVDTGSREDSDCIPSVESNGLFLIPLGFAAGNKYSEITVSIPN